MRVLCVVLVFALAGCNTIQEETRVERGALLRSYDREIQLGNKTVQAIVTPKWPDLEVSFLRYDTCRTEKVEEYAEQHITERTSRGMGPAIALGVSATLVGGVLVGARGAFSNEPNRSLIDASGHYGPSPRQQATGWGTVALVVGLPALTVGLVDYARTGESTEAAKGEQVISARDALCKPEPVNGTVEFLGGPGPRTMTTANGTLTLNPDQVRELGDLSSNINSETVFFAREEDEKLSAFRACAQLLPAPSKDELRMMGVGQLRTRLELLDACDPVAPEAAAEGRDIYGGALSNALRKERPSGGMVGPRLESLEDVMAVYAPKRRVAEGTADALALERGELKAGEAVLLIGQVRGRNTVDAAVVESEGTSVLVPMTGDVSKVTGVREQMQMEVAHVQVGKMTVTVLLEPGSVWDAAVRGGARLEFVGVVRAGRSAEGQPIPFVEAVWARSTTP